MLSESEKLFKEKVLQIKTEESFIPRNYRSMGGMWTVDTWKKDDYEVKVMDEGYTTILRKVDKEREEIWSVVSLYLKELKFEGISEESFIKELNNTKSKLKVKI